MKITCHSPEETLFLGERIGRLLGPGDVLLLTGDLGAGKTLMAKGTAKGLGVEEHVSSPTYTIINEYQGRLPFYHLDVYRLNDSDEALDLGLEEYFYGQGVTMVEWPQRIEEYLPQEFLQIKITKTGEEIREIEFFPVGQRYQEMVEELKLNAGAGD